MTGTAIESPQALETFINAYWNVAERERQAGRKMPIIMPSSLLKPGACENHVRLKLTVEILRISGYRRVVDDQFKSPAKHIRKLVDAISACAD